MLWNVFGYFSWSKAEETKETNEKSEAFQCKICLLDYQVNNEDLTPILLKDCGHTICFGCAKLLQHQGKNTIKCPLCRHVMIVNDVKQLPKNYALLELLEEKKVTIAKSEPESYPTSDVPCVENPSHDASVFCSECMADFCEKCFDTVHNSKVLSRHSKLPMSKKPIQLPKCPKHPYNKAEFSCMESSCKSTSSIICHTCLLSEHKDHSYTLLMTILEDNQSLLRNHSETANRKMLNLQKVIFELSETAATFKPSSCSHSSRIAIITEHFDRKKLEAIKSFEAFSKNNFDELDAKKKRAELELESLAKVQKAMNTMLKTKKNLEKSQELLQRGHAATSSVFDEFKRPAGLREVVIQFPEDTGISFYFQHPEQGSILRP